MTKGVLITLIFNEDEYLEMRRDLEAAVYLGESATEAAIARALHQLDEAEEL
jgi:hypothetical protein